MPKDLHLIHKPKSKCKISLNFSCKNSDYQDKCIQETKQLRTALNINKDFIKKYSKHAVHGRQAKRI